MHITSALRAPVAIAARQPQLRASQAPEPADRFSPTRIAATAAVTGAIGTGIGLGTALMYANMSLGAATSAHMTLILAGGAVGAAVLGKCLQPKIEPPMSFAVGALAGAGLTWGTSAFGLMGSRVIGGVAGGALGALYGGIAGMVLSGSQA